MSASALPSHLRAPANEAANAGSFGKHHGKSQSHMVSSFHFHPSPSPLAFAVVALFLSVVRWTARNRIMLVSLPMLSCGLHSTCCPCHSFWIQPWTS